MMWSYRMHISLGLIHDEFAKELSKNPPTDYDERD